MDDVSLPRHQENNEIWQIRLPVKEQKNMLLNSSFASHVTTQKNPQFEHIPNFPLLFKIPLTDTFCIRIPY